MSALDKIIKLVADSIKMNDRLVSLADKLQDLSKDVSHIDRRLVRVETVIDLAQNKRLIAVKKEE